MGRTVGGQPNDRAMPILLQLGSKRYDVTEFASKHPGGEKVLRHLAGEDVERFMKGELRVLGVKHEHSEAAYKMLEKYDIDNYHKGDSLLDSKQGVLRRIPDLGHDYWNWIHQPYEGTIRLFDSNFLESMTRTMWYVVPLVWLPIVTLFSFFALNEFYHSYGLVLGGLFWTFYFTIGVLTWTLTEYLLHRFVFHWQPDPNSGNKLVLHFLLHGLHHKTPMDPHRLVFPPVPATLIVGFFYLLYVNTFPWSVFCAFGSGKLFGYVCYDMIHYYLHHGSPSAHSNMHFRKVYHSNHHFKDFDAGYGISTSLWDYVFETVGMGPL